MKTHEPGLGSRSESSGADVDRGADPGGDGLGDEDPGRSGEDRRDDRSTTGLVKRTVRKYAYPRWSTHVEYINAYQAMEDVARALEEGREVTGGYQGADRGVWITYGWSHEVELVLEDQ